MDEPTQSDRLPGGVLHVSSMYGAATRKPIIMLTYDAPGKEFEVQMSVDAARNHAMDILEVCESAIGDAFLFEFVEAKLHQPPATAGAIVGEFRVWRAQKRV